jgi:YidC/Oxa1 family membrane protein insertase
MNLDFIAYPLGQFLYYIYKTLAFNNYGLAIIIFTVIVRLVLLPLTIKQYKSTTKMQLIQPEIQHIQKKYKHDREKMNQELMRVYSEHDINPASGCLPLLIQLPIILSLYWVIVQPLKFMLKKTAEQIDTLVNIATQALGSNPLVKIQRELVTLNYFNEHREALSQTVGILDASELINFNFLGLKLGYTATYNPKILFGPEAGIYLPLLLLPIIGVITTYLASKLGMPATDSGSSSSGANMSNSMTKSMLYMGPIMTLIFSFQLPAGVVLYWIAGYVFQIFQQLYINKVLKKQLNKQQQQKKAEKEKMQEQKALNDSSTGADASGTGGDGSDAVKESDSEDAGADGSGDAKGGEGKTSESAAKRKQEGQKKKKKSNKQDKYAERKKGGGKKK